MSKGLFVVIDGSDGSGKGTQHALLVARLQREGVAFEQCDFPQYGQPSAYFVEQYLNGKYGGLNDVPAFRASVFYALDRFAASFAIRRSLDAGKIVIANRFTASNLAHQGAKLADAAARAELYKTIEQFEHETLNIPKPDLNIILSVPATRGQQNVDQKAARSYTAKKRDIHEADVDFLRRSVEVYDELCQLFPGQFARIDCMQDDATMLPVEIIHERIWEILQGRLAAIQQV